MSPTQASRSPNDDQPVRNPAGHVRIPSSHTALSRALMPLLRPVGVAFTVRDAVLNTVRPYCTPSRMNDEVRRQLRRLERRGPRAAAPMDGEGDAAPDDEVAAQRSRRSRR